MTTRPLELASRLRPEPRHFDWLFFVNVGLLVLFFDLFGSRFVLAPGLSVELQLPQMPGARASATQPTHYISVTRAGTIFVDAGPVTLAELKVWLKTEAKKIPQPSLLVRANKDVKTSELTDIASAAHAEGFSVVLATEEPSEKGP